MLDDAFTYGGGILGLAALGAWLLLAVRIFPSFEAFVRGFDDELHLGAPRKRAALGHQMRQAAVALTAVAALSLSVAYAIPG